MLNNKIDYIKRGAYDELYTPTEAVDMILPYLPQNKTIWEATDYGFSNITKVLKEAKYEVKTSHIKDGIDFLTTDFNNYDIMITNPPYSLKDQFLQKAFENNKPFMMLLPLTTLEGVKRNIMFNENKIQLLIPSKRFNFKPEKNSSAWFQTSWFCYKMDLPNDLNFIKI